MLKEQLQHVNNIDHIHKINKGFSNDEKYVIDDQYLLRVFSKKGEQIRREEFDTINRLAAYSTYIPKAIEFGKLGEWDLCYMILTYFPGEDGEVALKYLTEEEQYAAGVLAGKELKKLHALPAPANTPPWYEQKKRKSDRYIEEMKQINTDKAIKEMLETYIKENEALMKNRPNTFQHDDFHPANLLIHEKSFAGIIDFGRMDWGDPIHDLTKLGFFSSRISIAFTRGIVDGYHADTGVQDSFWELYTLYSAMHIVSSLVWGKKMGIYEKMLAYSLDVIRDHEDFNQVVPAWYRSKVIY